MLDLAARLALRGAGLVEPNPMVGAVLVRGGRVIGLGHHRRFGGLHAEREAIGDCRGRGGDPRGATLYCTLEPCGHHGKQPPCVDAVLEAGIARVVYARGDPGLESGGGAARLRGAGVPAELSGASVLATGVSDPFVKRVTTGLPWVIAKWAQTIDGRVATRTGESKWISAQASRRRVHRVRARVDAVLTGSGTVLADDPTLNARDARRVRRVATRVVIDTDLDVPLRSALVRTAGALPTVIACSKDLVTAGITEEKRAALEAAGVRILGVPEESGRLRLEMLLRAMGERLGVTSVLVEAGPALLGSLFAQDLVDEAVVYVAPMLLGDERARSVASWRAVESLNAALRLGLWRVKRIGDDVELTYRRRGDPAVDG